MLAVKKGVAQTGSLVARLKKLWNTDVGQEMPPHPHYHTLHSLLDTCNWYLSRYIDRTSCFANNQYHVPNSIINWALNVVLCAYPSVNFHHQIDCNLAI